MNSPSSPFTISDSPHPCSMVPSLPRMCSPNPKCLLLKVDCQVTTRSLGKSKVTAIVSGTSRPSFSEKTPPDMNAAVGTVRSSAVMTHAIGWPVGPAVQKCTPVDVLGSTVGWNRTHPLSLPVWSVAAHPRFHLGDLADHSVLDPLSCVLQRARTFPL